MEPTIPSHLVEQLILPEPRLLDKRKKNSFPRTEKGEPRNTDLTFVVLKIQTKTICIIVDVNFMECNSERKMREPSGLYSGVGRNDGAKNCETY